MTVPTSLLSPINMEPWKNQSFLVCDVNADPVDRTRYRGAIYVVDLGATDRFLYQHPGFRDPASVTLRGDQLYVVDSSADPLGLGDDPLGLGIAGTGRGAVYQVDLTTLEGSLLCASAQFVNPIRLVVVP